jgi:hypothetical protein
MKAGFQLGIAMCLFLVLPVQAEVYKWIDEQGRVHYSDRPPTEDAPAYHLRTPTSADDDSPRSTPTDAERRARQKKLSDSLEADRREMEQAESKRKQQQAKREHNCKLARRDLNAAQRTNRIFDYDQQGNKVYYDEVQRQKFIAERRVAVSKWCQ